MDAAARRIREAALHRLTNSLQDSQPESPSHDQRCSADSGAGLSTPQTRALEDDVSPLGDSLDSALSAETMRLDDAVEPQTGSKENTEISKESSASASAPPTKAAEEPDADLFLESEPEEQPAQEVMKRPSALRKTQPKRELEPKDVTEKGAEPEGVETDKKKAKTTDKKKQSTASKKPEKDEATPETEEPAPVMKRPASKKDSKPKSPETVKEVMFPNAVQSFKDEDGVWQASRG